MLFGQRDDFAIEAEVDPNLRPPSAVWGRICVWCGGEALGRCGESMNALHGPMCGFSHLRNRLDDQWDEPLAGLDDAALWKILEGVSVFMDGRRPVEFYRYDGFRFLVNWCESFDGWAGFLLAPPADDVKILYRRPDDSRRSVRVSRARFLAATDDFVRWFEAQEARLRTGE